MFSIVFGAPLEAACWQVCSACLTSYLAGKLIAQRVVCDAIANDWKQSRGVHFLQ